MSYCCEFKACNKDAKVAAIIFDLDGRATRGVLNEFWAKYGKELDMEKEEKRGSGMTWKETATVTVKDYELRLTTEQFSKK